MSRMTPWKAARLAIPEYARNVQLVADLINVGERTLIGQENGERPPTASVIAGISRLYHRPDLSAIFCKEYCPIGQTYHFPLVEKSLHTSALHLLKELNHMQSVVGTLIDIVSDNEISEHEKEPLKTVAAEMVDLNDELNNFIYKIGQYICLESLIKEHNKEKATAGTVAFG